MVLKKKHKSTIVCKINTTCTRKKIGAKKIDCTKLQKNDPIILLYVLYNFYDIKKFYLY